MCGLSRGGNVWGRVRLGTGWYIFAGGLYWGRVRLGTGYIAPMIPDPVHWQWHSLWQLLFWLMDVNKMLLVIQQYIALYMNRYAFNYVSNAAAIRDVPMADPQALKQFSVSDSIFFTINKKKLLLFEISFSVQKMCKKIIVISSLFCQIAWLVGIPSQC